jgi:hypothetical protein
MAPPPCPRANLSDLPNLGRNIPAFLFAAACLPGTETNNGCAASSLFYTIAVSWNDFITRGWEAPGGNRYWETAITADLKDPRVPAILKLMAARSRDTFQAQFSKGRSPVPQAPGLAPKYTLDYKNLPVATVLQPNPYSTSQWKLRIGDLAVQVQPLPGETAGAFIKRGGYLLDEKTISTGGRLQRTGPQPWMGSKVEEVELWGSYHPADRSVRYTIRLVYKGAWGQTVTDVEAWGKKNLGKLCALASSPEAMAATTAALTAFPAIAPYLAAHGVVLSMCGLAVSQPPCVPQPPVPGEVNAATVVPTNTTGAVVQSVKGGTAWGNAASAAGASLPASAGRLPSPGGAAPEIPGAGAYPPGSIAWYDTGAGGFRVAVPFPGPGTTHRVVNAGVLPKLPAIGIRLVNKTEWERATLPWLQRSTTKIGMMVGGVAAAGAATVYAATRH